MQRWAITRNAVKKRASQLGVELLRPDRFTCLWPGEALDLGERFHDHLQAGRPARAFAELPRNPETQLVAKPASALVAKPASALVAQPEQLAALVAALRPADPLAVPDALARAAAAGHWLTPAELGALLGLKGKAPSEWEDGRQPRPGYRLERQQAAPRPPKPGAKRSRAEPVWWRVVAQ
jgi:hypothetical protein